MPLPTNINSYDDIQRVLLAAKDASGARFRCESSGKARHWRQRAYYFRKLYYAQQRAAAGNPEAYSPSSPFDNLFMTLDGRDVVIEYRLLSGTLLSSDGKSTIDVPEQLPLFSIQEEVMLEDDELFETAQDLIKEQEG